MRSLLLVAAFFLGSCFLQNQAAVARLGDSVNGLADETRWGRTELAVDRVATEYRAKFLESHRRWGRDFQIADTDIQRMLIDEETDNATVVVIVSWYDMRSMEANLTTIQQKWITAGRGFILESEEVVEGNAALIAVPVVAGETTQASASSTDG